MNERDGSTGHRANVVCVRLCRIDFVIRSGKYVLKKSRGHLHARLAFNLVNWLPLMQISYQGNMGLKSVDQVLLFPVSRSVNKRRGHCFMSASTSPDVTPNLALFVVCPCSRCAENR